MAVPLTLVEVLLTPLFTVICRFCGAVAVMVTVPGAMQVALPLSLMVAMAEFEVFQVKPSATVSSRLLLFVKVPLAVNTTSCWGAAVAELGLTAMLVRLGWPAPQPIRSRARKARRVNCKGLMNVSKKLDRKPLARGCLRGGGYGIRQSRLVRTSC